MVPAHRDRPSGLTEVASTAIATEFMVRLRLALLAALVMAGAGCGGDPTQSGVASAPSLGPSASTSSSPSPSAAAAWDFNVHDAVAPAGFEGLVIHDTVPQQRPRGFSVGLLSVAPNGDLLTKVSAAPQVDGGTIRLTGETIELITPGKPGVRIPSVDGSRKRQAVWGDSDERTLTWMETTSTDMFRDPWVILAYDRKTRRTHAVARAAGENAPSAPNGTVPFLAGGRVYWQAAELADGDEDRPARAHIYSRDLAAKTAVRREVTDASNLSVDGHTMFYVKAQFIDPNVPEGEARIHRRDLNTGKDEVVEVVELGKQDRLTQLASSAEDVAWIVRSTSDEDEMRTKSVLTLRQSDGTMTTIGAENIAFAYPVLTPNILGWDGGDDGGEWIFDRHKRAVVELGSVPGLATVQATGPHVSWREKNRWQSATLATA